MKIISAIVCLICTLRFAADNCYEIAYRALPKHNGYTALRFIETASVLNPTSIIIAQAERIMIPGALPGQRLVFYHPNDFDALIVNVEELRLKGYVKDARKFLFRAGKADPYSSINNAEMSQLMK